MNLSMSCLCNYKIFKIYNLKYLYEYKNFSLKKLNYVIFLKTDK